MEERTQIIRNSVLYGHYEKTVDRESAYEKLKARTGPIENWRASAEQVKPTACFHRPEICWAQWLKALPMP